MRGWSRTRSNLVAIIGSAVLAFVVAAAIFSYRHVAQAPETETENSISRASSIMRMGTLVQSFVSDKRFMGSVLAAQNGRILLDKGYGFANLERKIPNAPSTKYRLGSLTKQFTAASILLLEERGKLNVDDPIKQYLPDVPAAWGKITIFDLLTHTSGIPNDTELPEFKASMKLPTTPEKLIAQFRDKPLDFPPGQYWRYSNSGYILLGSLIEKLSGQSYAEFVRDNIFIPLGMKDTGYDTESPSIVPRAMGYEKGTLADAEYINMSQPFSAGGLYSTTGDLLRWERGLFGGAVLTPNSLKKMTTAYKSDYAFGLWSRERNGHHVIEHGGSINGFGAWLAYYPKDKLTIVVLGNVQHGPSDEIAANLASLAFGKGVLMYPDPTVPFPWSWLGAQ
jgi:CubicO group peptidase (beta-lactamase class C family)